MFELHIRAFHPYNGILSFENVLKRINALEEMEIMKAVTSDHVLKNIQNDNPLY